MVAMDKDYLINQKPMKALFIFALPMIIGNLFQQTYNMADAAIVGRYVSEQALAAVGACAALTNIFICIAVGGGIGASVTVSHYFGGHLYAKMKTAIFTALISFLTVSFLLGLLGFGYSKMLMVFFNTPPDCLEDAVIYLRIYFLGLPFLFMYNVLSSMFNAMGKSRIPLFFLIFSSILNVFLDYLFVTGFALGVAGVAWATLLAQGLSAVLSFLVLIKMLNIFEKKQFSLFDKNELVAMVKVALPSIFQQATVSIGMMVVQSVVNSFGSEALAGYSAGVRIHYICTVTMNAFGNAVSPFTAQNLGAGKPDRVIEGYHAANKMILLSALLTCMIVEPFHKQMVSFFLGDHGTITALETGGGYISFLAWFFCLIGFKMAVDGILRGAGDMKMFTIANFANLLIRVLFAFTFAPKYGIPFVWYAVPLGWLVNWCISFREYKSGKWRRTGQF